MKRCAPWFFVAFVLAILLTVGGLRPDRPMRVFFDSPVGRAPCQELSRFFDLAVTVPTGKPVQFSLYLEARRSRAGPDECLSLLFNFSFDDAPLPANDTGPPWIHFPGPPVLVRTAPRLKLQGTPGPPPAPKGEELPSEPAKTGAPAKIGVLQRVIFTTGFS
jgi:hypothetical protein